ncbi:MAG: hypothetical protein JJT82_00685 [Legionellaceae bacterium]|nr:hypothetical protein [Legionellaceae bacterium]
MLFFIKRYQINRLKKKIRALQAAREHNPPEEANLMKERQLYRELARIYQKYIGSKKIPFADVWEMACYRAAADIDDIDAKFWMASRLLEEAKVRQTLEDEALFANSINHRNMTQDFEEAHAWLESAKQFHHVEALRLSGLCYINGWGVPVDRDKGFDMVVSSIDLENSWAKVPEIFAKIGLNKPEFFSALTAHRKQNKPHPH